MTLIKMSAAFMINPSGIFLRDFFWPLQHLAGPKGRRLRDGEGGPQGQTEQKCVAFFAKGRASSEPGTARPARRAGQPQKIKEIKY